MASVSKIGLGFVIVYAASVAVWTGLALAMDVPVVGNEFFIPGFATAAIVGWRASLRGMSLGEAKQLALRLAVIAGGIVVAAWLVAAALVGPGDVSPVLLSLQLIIAAAVPVALLFAFAFVQPAQGKSENKMPEQTN